MVVLVASEGTEGTHEGPIAWLAVFYSITNSDPPFEIVAPPVVLDPGRTGLRRCRRDD